MKVEYPPLLTPGFHDINLEQFDAMFVRPFQGSNRRPELAARFKDFIGYLQTVGIRFELWINGSFTTEKVDPQDIDMAVFCNGLEIPAAQRAVLQEIAENQNSKYRFGCDVHLFASVDMEVKSYYKGLFGFSRSDVPKGIARLVLN